MPAVLLDTDIGSDVDDALALAVLLGSPEVELLGVTTAYGDTLLRARMARRLGRLAGRDLTVVPGAREPLSGREVWWAGHEGSTMDRLETEDVRDDLSAPEFLAATCAARPGEVDVISIAPMTDIALALRVDPAFARNVRRLWVMGCAFSHPGDAAPVEAEHNIRCDVVAAREVFASGIPVTVTGLDVTTTVALAPDLVARIAAAGELGDQLNQQIQQWLTFWGDGWETPHDPVTVMSLLRPDLFARSAPGVINVADGNREAVTEHIPSRDGSAEITTSVDVIRVGREIADRIASAAAGLPSRPS